jgi:hypothetical protein
MTAGMDLSPSQWRPMPLLNVRGQTAKTDGSRVDAGRPLEPTVRPVWRHTTSATPVCRRNSGQRDGA